MYSFEQVKKAYNEWLVKIGFITSEEVDLFGESDPVLENGDTDNDNENATVFTIQKSVSGEVRDFVVIEFNEPILDEDGEIEDYKTLGYDYNAY